MRQQHPYGVLLGTMMFHLQALAFVGLAWAGFWLLSRYFCDQLMRLLHTLKDIGDNALSNGQGGVVVSWIERHAR